MLRAAWTGGFATLASSVLGAITTPLQKVSASISNSVGGFVDGLVNSGRIQEENERLREEIRALNEKIVDYDEMKHENEVYNELWKIRDKYQDIEFEPAQVIGNDSAERFYSFTIDKGSLDGIDLRDSVHTPAGFVGVVTEVGLTYSKVSTILDPAINISVYGTRTRDTGVVSGTIELASNGLCKLSYLPRESGAAKGDLVATSGVSGRYPKDQIVGKILEVHPESHGNSLYAIIEPTADIRTVKDVLVVKSFLGQGIDDAQSSAPDDTSSASSDDEASSENGTAASENGTASSESGTASSESGTASSESGTAASPQSSAAPVPQSSTAPPPQSSAASAPQSSTAPPPQSSAASSPQSSAAPLSPQSSAAQPPQSSAAPPPESSEEPEELLGEDKTPPDAPAGDAESAGDAA